MRTVSKVKEKKQGIQQQKSIISQTYKSLSPLIQQIVLEKGFIGPQYQKQQMLKPLKKGYKKLFFQNNLNADFLYIGCIFTTDQQREQEILVVQINELIVNVQTKIPQMQHAALLRLASVSISIQIDLDKPIQEQKKSLMQSIITKSNENDLICFLLRKQIYYITIRALRSLIIFNY
ncbi:hypothetical protein TTHERM_00535230 (macronuclear) [Tetrahymena thermophila SB210]|uniref:Uncharacterized protein n=1 Tax=Tetrahymena thermophila (strain SB210) TaxID=312017 RepID=I7M3I0_TETTS|nr:hypothetical protein TTHERM_00535230 [Tetrahymena thermophila SB210]EAS03187.2 hypothetical protein TTHERM_00535230 [Tetrahymena thermophila SB210]|eukprot:XP_001023432.2 hypothetical protein TTHERM_00535230 [Tetrahymena thermophila SB210]